MMMAIIKTRDFTLRPLRMSDAEGYFEITKDRLSKRGFSHPPKTLGDAKADIKRYLERGRKKITEPYAIEINKEYAGSVILD